MIRGKHEPNSISALLFILVMMAMGGANGAYGAEAYLIPQLSHQISQPITLSDTKADTTADIRADIRANTLLHDKIIATHSYGNQQDVTAPLHEVRQRFAAQLRDAQQSSQQMTGSPLSPKERAGYQLSKALATSAGFFHCFCA